jgi:conjugative transfer signal peptidase TraF
MTRGQSDRLHSAQRASLAGVFIVLGIFAAFNWAGVVINTSPSLPIGLYIRTEDTRADLVEFCPAEPFATLANVRGYREAGNCPDGSAPLLKPVVAKSGDLVEISANGIGVNGVRLRNTAPLLRDTKGRPLEAWSFGSHVVIPGTVWVASTYDRRSFDSRYFGPVSTTAIRHHVKPLLVL